MTGSLRSAPLVVAALACAPLLARALPAQRPTPERPEHPEVRSLQLIGVRHVDRQELEQSIATSASQCRGLLFRPFCLLSHSSKWWAKKYLDETELRRDVLRIKVFYWKRGYREAQVDTAVVPQSGDEVRVVFRIVEGPPTLVEVVRVERPPSVLPDDQVRKLVLLRAGQPFDLLRLDSSLVLMRNVLWDRGYADAVLDTATVVDDSVRLARVTVRVDPRWLTRVGSITVAGNEEVSTRTIRTSLSFHEGDIYRRGDLTRSQRRLWESQLFRRAAIIVPPQGDSLKRIQVTVSEAPHHLVRTSGGFNTVDFLQVDGRYTRFNFFGGARRLDVQATLGNLLAQQLNGRGIFRDVLSTAGSDPTSGLQVGNAFLLPTWQASVDFTQPWFFSPRNSFGVSVFSHRRTAPGVFIDRGFGGNASFTRELTTRAPLSLSYHFEVTQVEAGDVYFCVNFGVCEPPTIDALRRNQRLSPLLLVGQIDRGNDPLSPSKGYVGRVELEHASTLTISDFRYNRAFADGAAYLPLGRRVLAGHLRVGWVNPLASTSEAVGLGGVLSALGGGNRIVHPRKRFYAGGSRSVRGYGENQLGPRALTLPASKLRFCTGRSQDQLPTLAQVEQCDLSSRMAVDSLRDRDFTPRPLGGSTLLEGSVEFRFPVWDKLSGAVFLDGAILGSGSLSQATSGAGALTPGVGIRYQSPVGPIRVDIGFNPSPPEDLPVVTEALSNGKRSIVPLEHRDASGRLVPTTWRYAATQSHGGITGLLNRLTLHLSIGQAY